MSEIAEAPHRKGCSHPKALRLINIPSSSQDGKNLPKSLGLMKNQTLQQSLCRKANFSALPGPALKLLVVLKCISSGYCFSPLSDNQMHFLYTSRGLMHSTFCAPLISQVLLTFLCPAAGAFGSISGCNTPFPNASNLQHLLLIFPDKIGFLSLPFMK